eukprot:CCRYP_015909-RA/>CCRYP_015909-RA protein AED:0.44 eAED:0.44 QI:81/1/1/1/0/0/2/87/49
MTLMNLLSCLNRQRGEKSFNWGAVVPTRTIFIQPRQYFVCGEMLDITYQ